MEYCKKVVKATGIRHFNAIKMQKKAAFRTKMHCKKCSVHERDEQMNAVNAGEIMAALISFPVIAIYKVAIIPIEKVAYSPIS